MSWYKEQYYLTLLCGGLPLIIALIVGTPIPEWFDTLVGVCGVGWIIGVVLIQIWKKGKGIR